MPDEQTGRARGQVHVGLAMWANRDWIGTFLPADTKPAHLLRAYRDVFRAVEGNTTFYGLPSDATVRRWAEDADTGFRFAFKLPRTITHELRLVDAGREVDAFVERFAPLRDRISTVSIQLPASFGPAQLGDLDRFLDAMPAGWPWAAELRHPAFFDGGSIERAVNDVLHGHGADRVLLDSRALFSRPPTNDLERTTHQHKPRLPVRPTATGDRPVVRFIGHLDEAVSAAHWDRWYPVLGRWSEQGRSPTVFIHTPDNLRAPQQALRFWAELAAHGVPAAPPPAGPPSGDQQEELRL